MRFLSKEARDNFMKRMYQKYGDRESRKGTIINLLV